MRGPSTQILSFTTAVQEKPIGATGIATDQDNVITWEWKVECNIIAEHIDRNCRVTEEEDQTMDDVHRDFVWIKIEHRLRSNLFTRTIETIPTDQDSAGPVKTGNRSSTAISADFEEILIRPRDIQLFRIMLQIKNIQERTNPINRGNRFTSTPAITRELIAKLKPDIINGDTAGIRIQEKTIGDTSKRRHKATT